MNLHMFGANFRVEPLEPEWTFLSLNGEQWLVVFTLALVAATAMLWWATRALVKGAERTAQQQLRAYISLESQRLDELKIGFPLHYSFVFRNVGQTPAFDVSVYSTATFERTKDKADFPVFGDPQPSGTTGPQQIIPIDVTSMEPLNMDQAVGVAGGTVWLHIWGEIAYTDAFGKKRKTGFRFVHGHHDQLPFKPGLLIKQRGGNDST